MKLGKALRVLFIFLGICLLTVVTQIGGLVYLLSLLFYSAIDKMIVLALVRGVVRFLLFVALYLLVTFVVVSPIAKLFGRVPLPVFETNNLKPLTTWTCLLNRHYVKSELREIAYGVADKLNKKYPGTVVSYLDAGFPFIDKFPLPPHLSHNDGKKLDLAFFYVETGTGKQVNGAPSFIGYGVYELPRGNEINKPEFCEERGYWQYSLLQRVVPQGRKAFFAFDENRTKSLVNYFASEGGIGKIFIEPHLKERLKLVNAKIRFHGCQAVRHDDHIHVQLR